MSAWVVSVQNGAAVEPKSAHSSRPGVFLKHFFLFFHYVAFGWGEGVVFPQSSALLCVNYLLKSCFLSVIGTSDWHLAGSGPCPSPSLFSQKLWLLRVMVPAIPGEELLIYLKKKRKCSQSLLPQGNVMWWNFCPISPLLLSSLPLSPPPLCFKK